MSVYVAESIIGDEALTKIGWSRNPNKRILQLRNTTHLPIGKVWQIDVVKQREYGISGKLFLYVNKTTHEKVYVSREYATQDMFIDIVDEKDTKLESLLHQVFSEYKYDGEWFSIKAKQVMNLFVPSNFGMYEIDIPTLKYWSNSPGGLRNIKVATDYKFKIKRIQKFK